MAFVRAAPDQTPTEAQLSTYCRERLAPHKIPRFWTFLDDFPLTASGKVQKYVLRNRFIAAHPRVPERRADAREPQHRRSPA